MHALEKWLHDFRIGAGPVFECCSGDGKQARDARLSDNHVVRLVKRSLVDAGIRSEFTVSMIALVSGKIVS
ncbi:hypothetical protein KUV64_15300 [Mameliella alba]|nr:hypothetical protein [Mameliella alba]